MQNVRAKIEDYLNENQIDSLGIEHEPADSAEEYNRTLKSRFEQQAKVLLLSCKKDGTQEHAVMAIQGHKKADFELLKQIFGASKVRLADREQLKAITGCDYGELHPFARLFGLKLLMDKDLLQEEKIYINAGRLDYSIVIDPKAVAKLENPTLF